MSRIQRIQGNMVCDMCRVSVALVHNTMKCMYTAEAKTDSKSITYMGTPSLDSRPNFHFYILGPSEN